MASNVTAALMPKPFMWGSDGKPLSPEEAAARRAAADRLRAPKGYTPEGFWSLLGSLAGEGVGQMKENQAVDAEKAGHASVAEALNKARESGDYMSVMSDPWVTPQQSAVASALQGRAWNQEDQRAAWAREDARYAQQRADAAAAASRPEFKMFEAGGDQYRYNANDPNSRPELFFDAPDAAPKTTVVNGQLVNEATGEVVGDYRDPDKGQPLINAGGGSIFDPNTKEWITNPTAPAGVDFGDIAGVRKEVQALPSYKNLAQATPIYNAMVETAGRDSRASDLNLVYGLGKIMDPTSVVREGEMFMVKDVNTLPDKVIEGVNSLLTGSSTLSPDTRKAILTEAFGRVKGYEDAFNNDAKSYTELADRYKINPDDILPGFKPQTPYTAPGDMPAITSDAEYDALPSGATFKAPDGSIRKKP